MPQEHAHPAHIRLALAIYLALPVSVHTRRKLRDFVFTKWGGWFRQSGAFTNWSQSRDPLYLHQTAMQRQYGQYQQVKAPKAHAWYELALAKQQAAKGAPSPTIDVIMPVYKGYDDTLQAIYLALTAGNQTPHELIVINDASPDLALVGMLKKLAGMGLFTLLENAQNLGFVQTANKGMQLHEERDCLLLNADCMVYEGYLDRMLHIAQQNSNAATITPLSNNGELCSYPLQWRDNNWCNELSDAQLNALCWQHNATTAVQAPTGVGYCMYVRRKALDCVGYFDAEHFGRGYGEENDFCMRAIAAGYTNLLAMGVFVRHVGGTSFQNEKSERIVNAMKMMDKLHPAYGQAVQTWKQTQPDKAARIALDLARLEVANKPSVLMILHSWGGGTEKHVRDMARWLEDEGVQIFYLKPVQGDSSMCQLGLMQQGRFKDVYTPNLHFSLPQQQEALVQVLQQLQLRHVHVHHLIGYDEAYYSAVAQLAEQLHVAYDVTLHDYFAICPRTNLIGGQRIYCGEPDDVAECNRCLAKHTSPITRYAAQEPEVGAWRAMQHAFLQSARHVYVPNEDVAQRMARYFADVPFTLRPHPEALMHLPPADVSALDAAAPKQAKAAPTLRIALIGALHELKGAHVFKALVQDAAARNLGIEFHVFGEYGLADSNVYAAGNVLETGKYQEADLPQLVAQSGAQVALFLSVWPETFSYTLSQAYQLGLYPVAFDLGAPAQRIRACGWGHLLPLANAGNVQAINDALLALELPETPPAVQALAVWNKENTYSNLLADYYQLSSELFAETTAEIKEALPCN